MIRSSSVVGAGVAQAAENVVVASADRDDTMAVDNSLRIVAGQPGELAEPFDTGGEQSADRTMTGHRSEPGSSGFEKFCSAGIDELPSHEI